MYFALSLHLFSTSLFPFDDSYENVSIIFFSGLAYWNTPCHSKMGVSVNDASGLSAAYTVTHEMGHK